MPAWESIRGIALLQRGTEDLVAFAGGTTGTDPDTACMLSTRFQICSVSKTFTAAAVLALADRGVLSVSDPVSRWIDGCPATWAAITVHHLLTHTAGLEHWWGIPGLDPTVPLTPAEELQLFSAAPLLSAPGERFSYSSPGYALLARIVERAADQPYASFLATAIFDPLGMTSTFTGNGDGQPQLATGHMAGVPVRSFELDATNAGAGDVWSTAHDLARWDRALAAGEILTPDSRQAMFAVQVAAADDDGPVRTDGHGYGWCIGSVSGTHPMIYHPGDNAGFRAVNAWFPRDEVRMLLLTNDEATAALPILLELIAEAFPQSVA